MTDFSHNPVMIKEVLDFFASIPTGVVIDATLGGAGHTDALLRARPDLVVIGIDQDDQAIDAATARLSEFGARANVVRARFDQIKTVVAEKNASPIVGILFDLGVSSPQFDVAGRGFSYRHDAPLDMRMDTRSSTTAADIVNNYSAEELVALFRENGERYAVSIAASIIANRPINTTNELVELIRDSIPARARRLEGHPARHVFQALRIEVNDELNVLRSAIADALDLVVPGGRIVTLAYHSGEDRIIKELFANAASGGCVCPANLPCGCGAVSRGNVLTRGARKPSEEEIELNPRAKSARLRSFEVAEQK